jgi:glycosyltransferase involved in cell wall biosynthesis
MKILVVSTSFPMRMGDALSPFVWEYCAGLKDRGWDITVLVPHHTGLQREENWNGIRIRRFKYLPERFENLAYSGGLLPGIRAAPWKGLKIPFYIYSMYSETLAAIAEESFDLVNFHWLFPACFWFGRFRKRTKIPAVFTGHGTDIRLAARPVFRFFADRSLVRSSALTLNSEYMKGILNRNLLPGRVEIIPMGVDTGKFRPTGNVPSESKKIIYIGRLISQKGVEILLDAFIAIREKIPDARLEIIGYGPEKSNLASRIEAAGMRDVVSLCDPVGYDMLPDKYRSARALALPSIKPEGFGITSVEAAACGVPTVTFGLGGTKESVRHLQTGIVVENSMKALSEGLTRILTDDALADRLGESARISARERYSWTVISEKFDKLFREVIEIKK